MTKKQPLHNSADMIYYIIERLGAIQENVDNMRLPTAYRRIQECKKDLNKVLSTVREKALREEGEHRV